MPLCNFLYKTTSSFSLQQADLRFFYGAHLCNFMQILKIYQFMGIFTHRTSVKNILNRHMDNYHVMDGKYLYVNLTFKLQPYCVYV